MPKITIAPRDLRALADGLGAHMIILDDTGLTRVATEALRLLREERQTSGYTARRILIHRAMDRPASDLRGAAFFNLLAVVLRAEELRGRTRLGHELLEILSIEHLPYRFMPQIDEETGVERLICGDVPRRSDTSPRPPLIDLLAPAWEGEYGDDIAAMTRNVLTAIPGWSSQGTSEKFRDLLSMMLVPEYHDVIRIVGNRSLQAHETLGVLVLNHEIGSRDEAKALARALGLALKAAGVQVPASVSLLEVVARLAGMRDWNTLSAALIACNPEDPRHPKAA